MKLFQFNKDKSYLTLVLAIIVISLTICDIKSDSVCSLKTLKKEILEDIEDNGMLDCLRYIPPPHFKDETEKEKNLRILAQWDSSCSFESSSNWKEEIRRNFGITELSDVNGDPVQEDFNNQADLCEIVRSAAAKNLFNIKNLDMRKLKDRIVDLIDCAGPLGEKEGPRICAASSSSFFNEASWTIFLNSSNIKLQGKPNFAAKSKEEKPNSNGDEDMNPQVEKLMKFSKDQLKKKGGLFAKLINKTKSIMGKIGDLLQTKKTNVQFFSSSGNASITENKKYKMTSLKPVMIPVDIVATMFSFYMISQKINSQEILKTRLNLNGRQVSESRQSTGPAWSTSISSGTIFNLDPKGIENGLTVDYKSSKSGEIKTSGDTNFTMATILIPNANIFKYVNTEDYEVQNSKNQFAPINEKVYLNVNNDKDYDSYYLVYSNASVKLTDGPSIFGTIMTVTSTTTKQLQETISMNGPSTYISTHSAMILNVKKQETLKIGLNYLYSGQGNLSISNSDEKNTIVGISAMELPKGTKVYQTIPDKDIILFAGSWKSLGVAKRLNLLVETKLFILYHFNIKTQGKDFVVRLKVNSSHSPRSVMSFSEMEYSSGQGYVLETLKPGNYNIDLEFTCMNCKGTLPAGNISAFQTKQVVSMTIVEFN